MEGDTQDLEGVQDDRRKHERRPIDLGVRLQTPISCTLADISAFGARLSVNDPHTLPDEFLLELHKELRRWCRVRWRSQSEVGVEFIHEPSSPLVYVAAPSTAATAESDSEQPTEPQA